MELKKKRKLIKYYLYFGIEEMANKKYYQGKMKDEAIKIAKKNITILEAILFLNLYFLGCFLYLSIHQS